MGLVFELVTFLTILSSPSYNQHLLIPSPNQQPASWDQQDNGLKDSLFYTEVYSATIIQGLIDNACNRDRAVTVVNTRNAEKNSVLLNKY